MKTARLVIDSKSVEAKVQDNLISGRPHDQKRTHTFTVLVVNNFGKTINLSGVIHEDTPVAHSSLIVKPL